MNECMNEWMRVLYSDLDVIFKNTKRFSEKQNIEGGAAKLCTYSQSCG